MTARAKFNPTDIYETPEERFFRTAQKAYLAKDEASGTYCLGVINRTMNVDGYAVLGREDLIELRDALNRELAS